MAEHPFAAWLRCANRLFERDWMKPDCASADRAMCKPVPAFFVRGLSSCGDPYIIWYHSCACSLSFHHPMPGFISKKFLRSSRYFAAQHDYCTIYQLV